MAVFKIFVISLNVIFKPLCNKKFPTSLQYPQMIIKILQCIKTICAVLPPPLVGHCYYHENNNE